MVVCGASLRAEEPFDYFQNSWNVIGLKDYNDGTRITPDNELLLAGGDKVANAIRQGTDAAEPEANQDASGRLDADHPAFGARRRGALRFHALGDALADRQGLAKGLDWPTEGENYLNWITVRSRTPATIRPRRSSSSSITGKIAVAKTRPRLGRSLPASRSRTACGFPSRPARRPDAWSKEDPKLWLERTVEYWRGVMAGAAKIEVPCRKATDALRAAHVCQLIASDHGVASRRRGFLRRVLCPRRRLSDHGTGRGRTE